MSVSEGEYDRLENPWYVHGPISLAVVGILTERAITLLFWGLESNPLVISLGITRWIALTAVIIPAMLWVWYWNQGVSSRIVRALVWGIAVFHASAAVTNLVYVVVF